MAKKWIKMVEETPPVPRKTKIWYVENVDVSVVIGQVRWYNSWRRYAFFPAPECVFEQDCLRDIADFVEAETAKHKEQQKQLSLDLNG